ncbi:testis expressed 44 [Ictidomys tridecemlineatus]|uniref:testis-expressed protein 44 n=1 Tax=Ictidomys tridecemlineatus TaxID=43179 RepID=UPI00038C3127|nr:testis-expressed protein 44 [Ictidomys tridecemlineatus]KAG3275497.1 testis expressed 44 [Ictidomys tridecemlineatus]
MTTVPSEEAKATSSPRYAPSEAFLGNEADHNPAGDPTGGSQGQAPLPADVSPESSAAEATELQDVDQATSEAKPTSGDQDKNEVAPGSSQKPAEITPLVPQDPGAQPVLVGSQNLLPVRLAGDKLIPQDGVGLLRDSQAQKGTPPQARDPKKQRIFALPAVEVPPFVGAADPATAGAGGQLDPRPTGVTQAAEEKTKGPQMVTGDDLVDSSTEHWVQSFPPSAACNAPPPALPSPHREAPGRRPLDSDLYMADEDNGYLRSMTSLLGGGEGSIGSLANILVWSEPMGMTMAMAFLTSSHGSPTELLPNPGSNLHSVSSILGNASSAFSSGLATGTSSALRSVTQVLETVERRTTESIRSAVRFLTSHLVRRRFYASPS